ncbi:hypothetical protein [Peredibacter starrii]|uniref:Uncharacterized protein n=1 Tax=Peredibacter starrii TaxID=28202 RepID=A0AAX4HTA9_9BACT|nr:hypothetical protein [Peredibacter starrii]WPU66589.1 hypothetical protein SOO65_07510 [Peredibacter starrii]
MAQRRLIKLALGLIFVMSSALAAESDLSCKVLLVKSQNLKASQEVKICTLREETYFISANCQDLSCRFMKELKGLKLSHSPDERPGMEICKNLKGTVEEVTVEKISYSVLRCVFAKDKSFISLNLLESWDGKTFKGPSTPIDL